MCGYAGSLDSSGVRAWLPGHKNWLDADGAYIAALRMFPSLCAWLSKAGRPSVLAWGRMKADTAVLTARVFENLVTPGRPGCLDWTKSEATSQPTVDASLLGYGAWLIRDTLLPLIPASEKKHFQDWLSHFSSGQPYDNNWSLFWIVNHAARKALGWPHDQGKIDQGWTTIEKLSRGGGWMTDGGEGNFDDYNWWVFGTHELWWDQMDGKADPARSARLRERLRGRLEDYPYFFASDGSISEFGRSLSYKFGRLGCPIQAYQMGLWPHSAGMLKRLVRLHLRHYDAQGAIDRTTHTVRQELSEFGNPAVREDYIDTGHPYWCMHAFTALWQLAEDDPFWTCAEEPLPVESGDFSRLIAAPGWILQGTKKSGQVDRHNLGSRHGEEAPYRAKYSKLVYGSHFPVNLGPVDGDFGPDNALCLRQEGRWEHPGAYVLLEASPEKLVARYTMKLASGTVMVETTLRPFGEGHRRSHKLFVPAHAGEFTVVEGGAPLGYAPGQVPAREADPLTLQSSARRWQQCSLIRGLRGYHRALLPAGFRGHQDLNAVHALAVVPVIEADVPSRPEAFHVELECLAWATSLEMDGEFDKILEQTRRSL